MNLVIDILLAVLIAFLALLAWGSANGWFKSSSKPPVHPQPHSDDGSEDAPESYTEQMARDPVGFVRHYGTPEDAERFKEQGIDLEGLGYQPPSDR